MTTVPPDILPPVALGWPPDQQNTPPCPVCQLPMADVPLFQVNLVGLRQIQAGAPAVEIADVQHLCPKCGVQVTRRYQRGQ